jgi:hypothetical protein
MLTAVILLNVINSVERHRCGEPAECPCPQATCTRRVDTAITLNYNPPSLLASMQSSLWTGKACSAAVRDRGHTKSHGGGE